MVNAYIPSNLCLKTLLKENPPEFKYHIDHFRYILSLITEIPANNKKVLEENDFVPVNKRLLQKRIHDYAAYIKYLLRNDIGILETDYHYIPREKSQGYRFKPAYCTPIKVEQITKRTLVKSLRKKSKHELKMQKKYCYLRKWFNGELVIDFEKAYEYLQEQLNENLFNGVENALLKFNANCIVANRFHKRDFYFKVDKNIFRLHTLLTIMKSELRNFITYGGQKLVSVDYKNSQPCLSAGILSELFYSIMISTSSGSNSSKLFNLYNISRNKLSFKALINSGIINEIVNYIMLVNNRKPVDRQGFSAYVEAVENGRIYKYIQEQVEATTGIKIADKKTLKAIVFTVLFTDNRFIGQKDAEVKRIFRNLFPDVYEVFALIKKKDSTLLPRILQTIESKLMLDRVAKRIAKDYPKMPMFTIHDSIVCPVGYELYVAQVMKEEMYNAIGITPSVAFDYWTPENLVKKVEPEGQAMAVSR